MFNFFKKSENKQEREDKSKTLEDLFRGNPLKTEKTITEDVPHYDNGLTYGVVSGLLPVTGCIPMTTEIGYDKNSN